MRATLPAGKGQAVSLCGVNNQVADRAGHTHREVLHNMYLLRCFPMWVQNTAREGQSGCIAISPLRELRNAIRRAGSAEGIYKVGDGKEPWRQEPVKGLGLAFRSNSENFPASRHKRPRTSAGRQAVTEPLSSVSLRRDATAQATKVTVSAYQ